MKGWTVIPLGSEGPSTAAFTHQAWLCFALHLALLNIHAYIHINIFVLITWSSGWVVDLFFFLAALKDRYGKP
jgi:hypothetical protein